MKIIEALDEIKYFFIRNYNSVEDFLWALSPKNWRFWMVKPNTLNVQYNDAKELYLHTSMKVLCDFYHSQLDSGHISWNMDDAHAAIWDEIEEIAYWWENVYPTYKNIWVKPDSISYPYGFHPYGFENDKEYYEYWAWLDETAKRNILNNELEQEMVERLAKIYKWLWN